ncbi:hypothetical protein EJ110_NYTH17987 [Nymphaea thermarum]|nr:hypothetical protein EJ110_NYTH17987 [Nymphaea thermarum]
MDASQLLGLRSNPFGCSPFRSSTEEAKRREPGRCASRLRGGAKIWTVSAVATEAETRGTGATARTGVPKFAYWTGE